MGFDTSQQFATHRTAEICHSEIHPTRIPQVSNHLRERQRRRHQPQPGNHQRQRTEQRRQSANEEHQHQPGTSEERTDEQQQEALPPAAAEGEPQLQEPDQEHAVQLPQPVRLDLQPRLADIERLQGVHEKLQLRGHRRPGQERHQRGEEHPGLGAEHQLR